MDPLIGSNRMTVEHVGAGLPYPNSFSFSWMADDGPLVTILCSTSGGKKQVLPENSDPVICFSLSWEATVACILISSETKENI